MNPIKINPAPWATDPTYPAGALPWSGGLTRINPGSPYLAAGAAPNQQPPAQVENYKLGTIGDSLALHAQVLAHAALTQWANQPIPIVGTDAYESVVGMRIARGFGLTDDTQREVIVVGRDAGASNKARIAHATDGSYIEPSPPRLDSIASFVSPVFSAPGAPGELILFNNNNVLAYSTTSTNTWSASTITLSGPPKVQAVHYVPVGAAAGYHAVITNSSVFYIRANSIASLLATPTTGTIPTPGGLSFDDDEVEFTDNGSVIMIAGRTNAGSGSCACYRSTNGGATWVLCLASGGSAAHCNVVYSQHHGKFFYWDDGGGLVSSVDGASWTLVRSGLTAANGFLNGRGTLLAVGPALVKPTSYTSAYSTFSGIAYSLNEGSSWNYHYFIKGSLVTSCLRSINGRVYATGLGQLFRSGILGAPGGEI
ncbi:MAG TPA: hypothetical protein VER11_34480 [Polyangiaceae bacterium]|nr:hypothetical protein [Polyangiaceae bacterium]